MAAGECLKCGKPGHIAKDCRTGWKYDPTAAVAAETTTTTNPKIKAIKGAKQNRKRKRKGNAEDSGKE